MILYLMHEEIDPQKWDACIEKSINSLPYALSWILNIVSPNWDALIEEDYSAVFPLTYRKKWGIQYLFPPPFTQQLGLFSINEITDEQFANFYKAIPKQFKFIDILTNWQNACTLLPAEIVFQKNLTLSLKPEYEFIQKAYSENLKRNIRKAEKEKLFIHNGNKPEELTTLFRENRGKFLKHISSDDYVKIQRICYQAIHKGQGRIINTSDTDNNLCASAFFLHSNNRIIFLFSGLSERGKKTGAMPFLIDSVIREFSGNDFLFDFEGSNDQNLARFYQSFGANESYYFRLTEYRFLKILRPAIRYLKRIKTELRK